jgi:hypothetical protein|tara:strand:+ start:1162 stop:1359 length:198 start_codon:yes stop_codon:yes gene_type:complete
MTDFEQKIVDRYGLLMTPNDLAELLKVKHVDHIRARVQSGDINIREHRSGRKIYYKASDVARLFE